MRKQANCPMGVVGWREWLSLPSFSDIPIKAKIDTGAKTSAIHAWNIKPFMLEGDEWVRFELHPDQKSSKRVIKCEVPVFKRKAVRSSNGHTETRFSVLTELAIGPWRFSTEITLTNRDEMGFRMLLGRSAIRQNFLVDCSHSFVQGLPKTKG